MVCTRGGIGLLQLTAKQTYDGFMICDAPFGSDENRAPLLDGIALEMDGEDVTEKIENKYGLCLWVAHPMTPGKHSLGLKCVPASSVCPFCAAHNLHAPMQHGEGWARARA